MCGRPTVTVVVPTDADEAPDERQPGRPRPTTGTGDGRTCAVVDEVIWFEEGEVEALPADLPDADRPGRGGRLARADPQGLRRQPR